MACVFISMHATPLSELLDKYLTDSLLPSEMEELMQHLETTPGREELAMLLEHSFLDDRYEATANPALQARIHEFLQEHIDAEQTPVVPMRKPRIWRFVAAAAVLILLLGGVWWMNSNKKAPADQIAGTELPYKNDVQPAGQGVILTLGDGRQLNLETSPNGLLTTDGGASLNKKENSISYSNTNNSGSAIVYNTIATSFGSTYQLELADGTKVWLNASSSLRFPANFSAKERVVELKGEGYFEVAKNSKQPFLVKSGDAAVQVLGTSFNMNAYGDDGSLRTTLLDGIVKMNGQLLKPGQQGILLNNKLSIEQAATDEVMAWRNGLFNFNYREMAEIMREVERWYNVKVVFAGPVKNKFTTVLKRNIPVSKLLRTLELTGEVKFGIEGNTITVMPVTP